MQRNWRRKMTSIESFRSRRYARILDLAAYLPEQTLSNDELAALYPEWPADKILAKTGIRTRHVAADGQTASDMAYEAAQLLFAKGAVQPEEIDFIILCTQAPDHFLPTSACVLQDRLAIPRSAGALDINLGCSGFVYGLSLAKGLIETGAAQRVLLLTADTYSKLIHPMDKSVRTLFGDAAVATLVSAEESAGECIGPFVFGTDGSGAKNLIVEAGGFRRPCDAQTAIAYNDSSGNVRTLENLYMNGAEVFSFTLKEVPAAVNRLLEKAGLGRQDIDFFVLHQANRFMLDALRKKLGIEAEKMPICMEDFGNTVSSTIPLALIKMREEGKIILGTRLMLVGFGVGYSWAATIINF
jgi:3-oxoacyl-[acyl-carrier-protein] synthase-3